MLLCFHLLPELHYIARDDQIYSECINFKNYYIERHIGINASQNTLPPVKLTYPIVKAIFRSNSGCLLSWMCLTGVIKKIIIINLWMLLPSAIQWKSRLMKKKPQSVFWSFFHWLTCWLFLKVKWPWKRKGLNWFRRLTQPQQHS